METITETKSKYLALSFTIGIHFLIILAFLLMGFVTHNENKPLMETASGENGMYGFEMIDINNLVVHSQASSSEKLISDPNEENIKVHQGNSSVKSNTNTSTENSEYETVLSKWNQLKNKKNQKANSISSGLKGGSSLNNISPGVENVGSFVLTNRSLLVKPQTILNDSEEGKVVVGIIVNEKGKVISAIPGQRGSTTTSASLYNILISTNSPKAVLINKPAFNKLSKRSYSGIFEEKNDGQGWSNSWETTAD